MRPDAPGQLLTQLADLLSTAVPARGTDLVVGARLQPDGVDLHLHPGDGHGHVADLLCGFDAPPDWEVIGVVARGRAVRLGPDRPGRRRADERAAPVTPVVVVHLQARSGVSRSLVGPPGGPLEAMAGPPAGRLADVCRRCLGLPTAPTDVPVLHWWAAQWLDVLVGEAGLESVRHEAQLVASFPGGAPFGPGRDLIALEHHGHLLEASCPWSALRQAAAAGAIGVTGVAADTAAWMDDGMFARWAMTEAPSWHTNLAELRTRLDPDLVGRLEGLLHRWGVLGTDPAAHPRPAP